MRRQLALALAAMFMVLSSSPSPAQQQKQPSPITSDRKSLCDAVLNMCVSDCYLTLGTAQGSVTTTCTRNCTRQYHRCKRGGRL